MGGEATDIVRERLLVVYDFFFFFCRYLSVYHHHRTQGGFSARDCPLAAAVVSPVRPVFIIILWTLGQGTGSWEENDGHTHELGRAG